MTLFTHTAFCGLALALTSAQPVEAQDPMAPSDNAPTSRYAGVPDDELSQLRGGFEWRGMTISFGADVRTYLNGELSLQTLVNWTPAGASAVTKVGPGLLRSDAAGVPDNLGGAALAALARSNPVFLSATGQTAIVQATNGTLQNILVNANSGISVSQQTNATITLSNYAGFADALRAGALANTIGRDIGRMSR